VAVIGSCGEAQQCCRVQLHATSRVLSALPALQLVLVVLLVLVPVLALLVFHSLV
jgi:hypothetical protein